jgi:hypothetical protein
MKGSPASNGITALTCSDMGERGMKRCKSEANNTVNHDQHWREPSLATKLAAFGNFERE